MRKIGRVLSVVLTLALSAGGIALVTNRQTVADWLVYQNYKAPAEISSLAEENTMTGRGRMMFYVSNPRLEDKTAFNTSCQTSEQTIVLGCYVQQRIYLYQIKDPRLDGVIQVTAAHEMLHAAYARLSTDEKKQLNQQLQKAFSELNDPRINSLIDNYRQTEPTEIDNELHSILGTEVETLPPALEDYYKRYFTDRKSVVAYAQKYESVFLGIKAQVEALDNDLAARKSDISGRQTELDNLSASLSLRKSQLDQLRASDPSAYNQLVPSYNQDVSYYNGQLSSLKQLIAQYNQIVQQRNDLALQQNQLVESLDSKSTGL